jgi:hypothetical protein
MEENRFGILDFGDITVVDLDWERDFATFDLTIT